MAVTINLEADKRVPFVDEDGATFVFIGENWASASFAMHIRGNPGDTGTPIIGLIGAAAGSQGISATYDAAYVYVDETGAEQTGPATLVLIQIDEGTLEALSLGTPYDKAVTLYYDLHVTPSGGVKRVAASGKFIINPGVTTGEIFTPPGGGEGAGVLWGNIAGDIADQTDLSNRLTSLARRYEAPAANVPVLANFTWVNQGSSTATDTATGLSIDVDVDLEMHLLMANAPPPSPPYDVYMRAEIVHLITSATAPTASTNVLAAIILRDNANQDFLVAQLVDIRASASGDEQNLYTMGIQRWTNPTTGSAAVLSNYTAQPTKWIRVNVTATTVTLYISPDGITWINLGTEAIADFVGTISGVGIGVRGNGATAGKVIVNQFGYVAPTI